MANFGTGVTPHSSAKVETGTLASEAIAHGDIVTRVNGQWALGQSDATTTIGATGVRKKDVGVAVSAGVANAPVAVVLYGLIENCSSLLPGEVYCISDTVAGDLIAHSGLTEDTDYVTVVAVGATTTSAYVNPIASGVVKNLV